MLQSTYCDSGSQGGSILAGSRQSVETTAMFSPKWKKEAKHLVKGALKFLHYKRDLLDEARIGEIESRRNDLIGAIKQGDKDAVVEASKQLRATCENSLPRERALNWFEENVEVMFVAIVIALGLRAYYLQPFRIPTGSMQPSLNGITGHAQTKDKWPSLPVRLAEKLHRGRTYVSLVAEEDMRVPIGISGNADIPYQTTLADFQHLHFFSRSMLRTADGNMIRMPAPANPMYAVGLSETLGKLAREQGATSGSIIHIPKGTELCTGYVDTGDLVLVNKFAYHFRKPKRGETFVFDTMGIRGIDERSGEQAKGSHYIKRLCGIPGDTLQIRSPHLLVDGVIAKEDSIERVMASDGYLLANREQTAPNGRAFYQYLAKPDDTLRLRDKAKPGMREYAALGDNTDNSLDSRYWGPVKEFNLVGPALFSLWPFTTGHWGFIE